MENFVLYEELGRGDNSVVYKGRRKGTINFVAIHCIEKTDRPQVTNTVRMTHDISHPNVVKFYEWYETSNHLWLVVELCTGGSLHTIITQDDHLPESCIQEFGVNLVTGLHYIHSLGILFCDLQPSKILLDGPGILKYADFGLSKVEGEDLDELFKKFADVGETWKLEPGPDGEVPPTNVDTLGSVAYTAPEVLQEADNSILSDLWSLGCVLYEMFTGHPPFLAENSQQLTDKIINKAFPPPKVKGSRFSSKPSPDFQSLIDGLLHKDVHKRLGWPGLVTHPFWQGKLVHLAKDLAVSQDIRGSEATTVTSSIFDHGGSSALGKVKIVDLHRSQERPISRLDVLDGSRPSTAMGDHLRPKTAPGNEGGEQLFTLSARPHTAVPPDDCITSPFKVPKSPLATREPLTSGDEVDSGYMDIIYHPSDFVVTPVVDNPKIQKPMSGKYDSKSIQVPPYPAEKILSLPEKEQEKHIKSMLEIVSSTEKGPPSQKRIHLLHYLATVSGNGSVASMLVSHNALYLLAKQIKDTQNLDIRIKLARVIGLLSNNTQDLDESLNLSDVFTILTEVIRDNVKNAKLKQGLLPGLGEALYLVAKLEEERSNSVESWSVPSMTYTVIARCCRDGEDAVVNHMAAKIIENVSATRGSHSQKFITNEIGQSLWYLFKHSTVDSLRITALSAMCRISSHSSSVFQSVIDTVGLTTVMNTLSLGIARIQQSVVTMFGALIISGTHLTRLLQDKDFLQKVMRLLESPSTIIRAKAFVVIYEIIKNSQEMLLNSCQSRLVMYIERDLRRQAPSKGDNLEAFDYLSRCLDMLVVFIIDMVPQLQKDIASVLESVCGRKHPSTVQAKQLKVTLPLLPVLLHLVTSQTFRPRIVNRSFVKNLGLFVSHVRGVEVGDINLEASRGRQVIGDKTNGASGSNEFITTVMSILEAISQHPTLLLENHEVVIETVLSTLADLVGSQNADTRALSLRLFTDIASVFFSQDQYDVGDIKINTKQFHAITATKLFPQLEQILLDQDPLPSYGLKFVLAVIEQNPAFIKQFEQLGLVAVIFQVLLDHQNNPVGSAMQSIVGIISCLVVHRETNMRELYEQGLIDYFTTMFFEVTAVCLESEERGDKTAQSMMQTLLETLHNIFKYVSEIVRKALQGKKTGTEAEEAEQLLLINKPLTDLVSVITQLLCHDDLDIADLSTKCLSLMIQLFGGENKESLSQENMECYARALQKADIKKQKIILRALKRLVSTDSAHADAMRQHGAGLAVTIRNLVQTASSHADVSISSLANEILKVTGHNS